MNFTASFVLISAAIAGIIAHPVHNHPNSTVPANITIPTINDTAPICKSVQGAAPVYLYARQGAPYSPQAAFAADHAGQAGQAIGRIINSILNKLFPLKDWNPARETFTKETTRLMWQNNPDKAKWVAAICYNKGWDVANPAGISDVVSMSLKLGAFHTDYDCMYMAKNNQFYTRGDGGFINLAYQHGFACSMDSATGDLTC